MIEFVKNKIASKKILILGFGREGESSFRFFRKYFPKLQLTIADQNSHITKWEDEFTKIIAGPSYLDSINEYDFIMKSPGIKLNTISFQIPEHTITSQTSLFLEFYTRQIIGVTGTKGKSTTVSLIYHTIKLFTDNVVLVGNIGVPAFDAIEYINENTLIVYELSAHQLEYINKAPHIAILLNLFQEHLDYFNSFEAYQKAKMNIKKYQNNQNDIFIYNIDDPLIQQKIEIERLPENHYGYSLNIKGGKGCWIEDNKLIFYDGISKTVIFDFKNETYLKGDHNKVNMMAAVSACKACGIPNNAIETGISSFQGLAHRLEYVGVYDEIIYYNDSIATIPEATIQAVNTLKKVDTIILGGFDRGINYDLLIEYLITSSINNIIMLGKAGKRIMMGINEKKHNSKNLFFVNSLEEGVKLAKQHTNKSGICLLSPAAASYDMFKNFEERGTVYKKLVREK